MNSSHSKIKNIIFVIAVVITLAVCLFCILACVPIKHSINKEIGGICWNIEATDDVRTVKATVDGDYYNYIIKLWNKDCFKGDIVITGQSNYNIPQVTAYFTDVKTPDGSRYTYASMLSYMANTNSFENRGDIFIDRNKKLSDFVICPSGNEDIRYAFSAASKEEAEKLDKELNVLMWGKQ